MIARCTAFIATSLDGYISRPDGRIDWLMEANQLIPSGEDCGFAEYMSSIDAIVMGRSSFEQVLKFDEWPYGTTHVYVLSRTLNELPLGSPDTTSLHRCSPIDLATLACQRGHQCLYIDGGVTVQSFLSAGLLSEITITIIPVLLGEGRPLFGKLPDVDLKLKLATSKSYPFGFVQNQYIVDREGDTVTH